MTREEFASKIDALNKSIREIEREKSILKKEYLKDNCPYAIGDKVRVENPHWEIVENGYVERIKVTDSGIFIPECAACKKDGTKHGRNKVYTSDYSIITKL